MNEKELLKEMKKVYSYPTQDNLNLQEILYKKREFYFNKIPYRKLLTEYEDIQKYRNKICEGQFELRSQQQLLTHFINPDTPFRGLLIFHGVGTGKTCGAISIAEQFKDQVTKYGTKIYILVSGPLMKEHWKDQLIYCTKNTYLKNTLDVEGKDAQILYNQAKYQAQQYYKIISYKSFYKKVLGQKILEKNENVKKKIYRKNLKGELEREVSINKINSLNNTILIVDEAHNITDNEYGNALLEIKKKSTNLKIILLTATPMINFADEIVTLINFIRPLEDQIDRNVIFTNDHSYNMKFKANGINYLKKMCNGYVSHFRGLDPLTFAEELNEGEIPNELYYTYLIRCKMEKFQFENYNKIVEDYDDSLDRKSQAIANFCFPGYSTDKTSIIGLYGKSGLSNLRMQLKSNKTLLQKLINETFFKNSLQESEILKDVDLTKSISGLILKLPYLKYFSIKFYTALLNLNNLIDGKKGSGTAFVYFNLVKIGIDLFSEILNLNGYTEFNSDYSYNITDETRDAITGLTFKEYKLKNLPINDFHPATYLIIKGQDDINIDFSIEEKKKILDSVFNKFENSDGRFIKIILGSKIMAEGITLENVAEVHIMDVYYNLSKVHQVLGRALRQCKHHKLITDKNRYPKLRIYKYVISLPNNDKLSTEELMYRKAELKYILIKQTERILKEISIDCPLNYSGNVFPEEIEKYKNCIPIDEVLNKSLEERKKLQICPAQCDFTKCHFECFDKKLNLKYYDSSKPLYKKIFKEGLDFSTFTANIARNEIELAKYIIKNLFKFRYVYTLDECIKIVKKNYVGLKQDLFESFFVYKALDELIPITENDFNTFSDIIYDKYNVPGYIIYRNLFYIFQPFNENENIPIYYRTVFKNTLYNDLTIYNYLKSIDILSIVNKLIIDKESEDIYNFNCIIDYYDIKPEYDYVGIIDQVEILNSKKFKDIFKLRKKREHIVTTRKKKVGIPTLLGAVCETKKKNELIEIAKDLDIDIKHENMVISKLCDLIKIKLLFLEKYSTNDNNNKYTYFIVPCNHKIYPFPLNLEDRVEFIVNNLILLIPIKLDIEIIKMDNGIFENKRHKDLARYQIIIKNVEKYKEIFVKFEFKLDKKDNNWSLIIE